MIYDAYLYSMLSIRDTPLLVDTVWYVDYLTSLEVSCRHIKSQTCRRSHQNSSNGCCLLHKKADALHIVIHDCLKRKVHVLPCSPHIFFNHLQMHTHGLLNIHNTQPTLHLSHSKGGWEQMQSVLQWSWRFYLLETTWR